MIFVEISLERGKDDPQRIFESLNSTGLDLSQSDLIRNYILMDLDPKNQNNIFDKIFLREVEEWGGIYHIPFSIRCSMLTLLLYLKED